MNQVRYLHIFPDGGFVPNRERVITIASEVRTGPRTTRIGIGYSIKSERDQYVRKTGNEHAYQRLRGGSSFILPSAFNSNGEISFWTVLITMYLMDRDRESLGSSYQAAYDGLRFKAMGFLYGEIDPQDHDLDIEAVFESLVNGISHSLERYTSDPMMDIDAEISRVYFHHISRYNESHPRSIDFSSIESA